MFLPFRWRTKYEKHCDAQTGFARKVKYLLVICRGGSMIWIVIFTCFHREIDEVTSGNLVCFAEFEKGQLRHVNGALSN